MTSTDSSKPALVVFDYDPNPSTIRPLSAEFPPPPAYEELAKAFTTSHTGDSDKREEVDDVRSFLFIRAELMRLVVA